MTPEDEARAKLSKQRIEELLAAMNLSPEEEAFAREQGKIIFGAMTRAYIAAMIPELERFRPVAAAAAAAHALIVLEGWAASAESRFPK